MRNVIKSMLSFSWGMSLFGMRQMLNFFFSPNPSGETGDRASEAFEAVTRAAEQQMDEPIARVFREGDRLQRELVDRMFSAVPALPDGISAPAGPGGGAPPRVFTAPVERVATGRLNPSRFVVLGEGLAAGMADFGLEDRLQRESFPAQMARQMQTELRLPVIQPPGIGDLPGFPKLPVRVPTMFQTTVREDFAHLEMPQNLAVPGL